jgi:hypothetical protein
MNETDLAVNEMREAAKEVAMLIAGPKEFCLCFCLRCLVPVVLNS